MRKAGVNLSEVIDKIKGLRGENVKMQVNKGRKRIEKYVGVIESVYPSIFTVRLDNSMSKKDLIAQNHLTYSYNEVLCGDVKISPVTKTK